MNNEHKTTNMKDELMSNYWLSSMNIIDVKNVFTFFIIFIKIDF